MFSLGGGESVWFWARFGPTCDYDMSHDVAPGCLILCIDEDNTWVLPVRYESSALWDKGYLYHVLQWNAVVPLLYITLLYKDDMLCRCIPSFKKGKCSFELHINPKRAGLFCLSQVWGGRIPPPPPPQISGAERRKILKFGTYVE